VPDTPTRTRTVVELDDGTTYEAVTDQRDYRRFDLTRARHGWPPGQEAPFILQGFAVAAALVRQGDIDGDPAALMDRIVNMTETGSEPVTPTDAGHGPASSSS